MTPAPVEHRHHDLRSASVSLVHNFRGDKLRSPSALVKFFHEEDGSENVID